MIALIMSRVEKGAEGHPVTLWGLLSRRLWAGRLVMPGLVPLEPVSGCGARPRAAAGVPPHQLNEAEKGRRLRKKAREILRQKSKVYIGLKG
jgi:hypothetical protein